MLPRTLARGILARMDAEYATSLGALVGRAAPQTSTNGAACLHVD
jgi:hypothetical protein